MSTLTVTLGVAFGLIILRKWREYSWGYCNSKQRLDGKTVVITGANSGIGKETARELVKRGATVILAVRNREAAQTTVKEIRSTTKDGEMIIVEIDLASFSSISQSAQNILQKFQRLDILINNAGVYYPSNFDVKTQEGFEIHYGVNHLGHFLLTNLLLPKIRQTPYSRIIIVSSGLYRNGKVDAEYFENEVDYTKRKGTNPAYSDSKLCNILHARELHKRLKGSGIGVYAICPGFTYTKLFRHAISVSSFLKKLFFLPVAFFFMRSAYQGAQTIVQCCVDPALTAVPFGFFKNCQETELLPLALDEDVAKELWDKSEEQCNQKLD